MVALTPRIGVISRGSVYYQGRPVSVALLKLMNRIDKLHMDFPFAGSRMRQGLLAQEGFKVGRLHVATLMKRMGIEALSRKALEVFSFLKYQTLIKHVCVYKCGNG